MRRDINLQFNLAKFQTPFPRQNDSNVVVNEKLETGTEIASLVSLRATCESTGKLNGKYDGNVGGKMAYQRWLVLLCVEARVTVLCTPLNAFSRLVPARYADTCSFYGVRLPMYTSTLPLNLPSSSSTHHFFCSSLSFKFTNIVLSKVISLFYISFYKFFSIQNSAEDFENSD